MKAGRQGLEPRLHGPEPRVLPLNYLPVTFGLVSSTEPLLKSFLSETLKNPTIYAPNRSRQGNLSTKFRNDDNRPASRQVDDNEKSAPTP